ncbi:MAG: ferrous iron transporter B [Planctomycetaceae bacterium]|nr:ferrous iron transporter B [Planctomycetaceae bacterium]
MRTATQTKEIVAVGRESVGKSALIAALSRRHPTTMNFRGSTVAVETYRSDAGIFVDTPGIVRQSDTETTARALARLEQSATVLLVVQATQLDEDLAEMLPLVVGKEGVIAVTFWDKVHPGEGAIEAIEKLERETGVPVVPLDAQRMASADREKLLAALKRPGIFQRESLTFRFGWRIEPRPGLLEHRILGPIAALLLLTAPALLTILGANRLADWLHPLIADALAPAIAWIDAYAPAWLQLVLTASHGDFGYGLLNMGPFLLVWALPTVVLFTLILAVYKSTGLAERMNAALDPLVRPVGLSGRDILRVMMGFGCNVPAVIGTRACSSCSRGSTIAAISYGAACSYQLPATLAVLAAAAKSTGRNELTLVFCYLGYLLVTTLVFVRLISPAAARDPLNRLLLSRRPFMQRPTMSGLWRELSGTLKQFFLQALPVFFTICVVASLLASWGGLDALSTILQPVMAVFRLPAEAALPLVLASVRKDGIFLFVGDQGLAMSMSAGQVLTAVYLCGVLLPCLVTALTMARETTWRSTGWLLARQAGFASLCGLVLAWGLASF